MKILFCSDGSKQSETPTRFGAQIAAACQAEVSILGIAPKPGSQDALLPALLASREIFKEFNISAEVSTTAGKPSVEIFKRVKQNRFDMVVIGTLCKNPFWSILNSWWRTNQVYKIIESIEPPVLVVFCDRPVLHRILLCTGSADFKDEAMEFAARIAQCAKAVVNLFHVMPEPPAMWADLIRIEEDTDRLVNSNSEIGRTLRRQKEILEKFGVFGEIRLKHGEVVPELLKELKQTDYDLIVSGSAPAEDRLRKYVMGDITREILSRAEIPILVIRSRKTITHFFRRFLTSLRHSKQNSESKTEKK